MHTTFVTRDDVDVMFMRCADDPAHITTAWSRFEQIVGSLRGRRFFGAVHASPPEYRTSTQIREGDDPVALGLEQGVIPGGRYVRSKLVGEPPEVYELLGAAFAELERKHDWDRSRPKIEFYRRRNKIDVLVPVS